MIEANQTIAWRHREVRMTEPVRHCRARGRMASGYARTRTGGIAAEAHVNPQPPLERGCPGVFLLKDNTMSTKQATSQQGWLEVWSVRSRHPLGFGRARFPCQRDKTSTSWRRRFPPR
jgi:hypothetical protein